MNRHSGTETRAGDETAVAPAAAGGAGAAIIEIEGLRKSYGETIALAGVSLDVHPGETLVLLGASGCGKTTLLRCINRLIEPSSGSIRVCGRDVAFEDPVRLRRGMGYMIQGVGLFPHRRIGENILTAARLAGWSKSEMGERLDALAELVKLPRDLLSRYPHELSGGQRQRAGVARALAADPPIVLMDEPFGALDPITRRQIRAEFRSLESLMRKTIVLVTHDVAEAVELGDRIALMRAGRVEQAGSAADLLFEPVNDYVRQFFHRERLQTEWMAVPLRELQQSSGGEDLPCGMAPETRVFEALGHLEQLDEAAFLQLLGAFFDYKKARARRSAGGGGS